MTMATDRASGAAVQKRIEATARNGEPICPNGCGLPYTPFLGHLAPGFVMTDLEAECIRRTAIRDAERRRTQLVRLGQGRRQVAVMFSMLLLAAVLAAMVAHAQPMASGVVP